MGDYREAFEEIYANHLLKVRFVAYSYLGDKQDAECLAQEIFMIVWNKIAEIDINRPMLPYLLTITKNRCLNILKARKAKYKNKHCVDAENDTINIQAIERTDAHIFAEELQKQIEVSLKEMTPIVRETFLLSRYNTLRYSELANHYGVSVKSIENRIMSALRILRKHCKDFLVLLIGLLIKML